MMEFNGKGQKWATYFDHFLNFSQFCHAKVLVNLTKKNWCSKLVQGDNGFSFFFLKKCDFYTKYGKVVADSSNTA